MTLHNAAAETAVKGFVLQASATGKQAADFHEVFRGTLEARTGPQSFRVPAFRARFLKLRVLSGHNSAGRLALAEFEAFAADGTNIVTIQGPEGRKMTGGLLRFTTEAGQEREWKAENINDGRTSGGTGSWAVEGPPPLVVRDSSQILDLTGRLDAHGRLTWDVPPGRWTVYRFLAANTGQKLVAPSPHSDGYIIDHFSAKAARMHAEYIVNQLSTELGDFRQTALKYYYACSYEVRGSIWTDRLPAEFRRRRGYDMRKFLPVLTGAIIASEDVSNRFRVDLRRTLSDLFVENFYRETRQTVSRHGLSSWLKPAGRAGRSTRSPWMPSKHRVLWTCRAASSGRAGQSGW